MRPTDRSSLGVVAALFLATFTLRPLTSDGSVLTTCWLLLLLVGAVSMVLRRAALGPVPVLAALSLLVVGFCGLLAASMPAVALTWSEHLAYLWRTAMEHIQTQAAPMAPHDGVRLVFVAAFGAVAVVTDLLVGGLRRPAWAIAPLGAVFLVPAIGLPIDTGVLSFGCIALGYLAILLADGLNRTSRWTRGLSRDTAPDSGGAAPVVWRAAAYLGGPALVAAVVLGLALPTLALPGFGFGTGSGGSGPLQLTDPTLDMRRNLAQPVDAKVMEYQTSDPGGLYLRMASLPQFNSSGWSNIQMRLNSGDALPPIPGMPVEPTKRRTSTIKVFDLRSEYLPLPYAPRSFDADGNWAFDSSSLVVLSRSRNNRSGATRDLTYTVESVDIAPDSKVLADALAGTPADASVTAAIPRDLPSSLIDISRKVTAEAETPAQKAAAIQAHLRSSRFTYSTEPLPGSGYEALENFLLRDRTGYCEQYAAAMALMARVVGIPSRVAIGFLPGERKGDKWEVTTHDMHSWPELFFSGYGWVRFEPTPSSVSGTAPPWSLRSATDPGDDPTDVPSNQPSAQAETQSAQPSTVPTQAPVGTGSQSGLSWGRTLLSAGIGLLVLVILAAPATIRVRRRSSRLTPGELGPEQVESAWAEIRDTVLDYGGSWPAGSPRTIGGQLAHRLDPEEAATMGRVATLVERSRYARSMPPGQVTEDLPQMTTEIRHGIAAPQTRWRRLRAFLLPRSLFRRH